MEFYVMYGESCVENYAVPGEQIRSLEKGCLNSEFQFLTHDAIEVELGEGGIYYPDYIIYGCIPLISDKFYNFLQEQSVDYLFYKPVCLTYPDLGIREQYWLALPPRINCLDMESSEVITEDNEYLDESELMREAKKIVIVPPQLGRYNIFRLANVVNDEIIVTEEFKKMLEKENFENVYFADLEE